MFHEHGVDTRLGEPREQCVQGVAVVAEVGQKRPDEGVGPDPLSVKLSERTETSARERRADLGESTQTIIRGGELLEQQHRGRRWRTP